MDLISTSAPMAMSRIKKQRKGISLLLQLEIKMNNINYLV